MYKRFHKKAKYFVQKSKNALECLLLPWFLNSSDFSGAKKIKNKTAKTRYEFPPASIIP
jgi:hypothetical protein